MNVGRLSSAALMASGLAGVLMPRSVTSALDVDPVSDRGIAETRARRRLTRSTACIARRSSACPTRRCGSTREHRVGDGAQERTLASRDELLATLRDVFCGNARTPPTSPGMPPDGREAVTRQLVA